MKIEDLYRVEKRGKLHAYLILKYSKLKKLTEAFA